MINKRELELYLHIPFCVRKCMYCDFLSAPADSVTIHAYMKALEEEIESRAVEFGDYIVVSVFVGGGTPSIAETKDIEAVLTAIRHSYRLADDAEITIEVNPGTVERKKLEAYRSVGINRLSIGLQSARNEELKRIGRIHSWQQFLDSYRAAVEAGFENVNVDIMSTLPGQSLENYRETLRSVLALEPCVKHISAYSLIVEEGTELYEKIRRREWQEPDEELDRLMYIETRDILEAAGYKRYEISNYAREGYECRHNSGYWRRREYVGFGIGAASLVGQVRFKNSDDLLCYIQSPTQCREEEQKLSVQEQMEEFMFLGLRMTEGILPAEFERQFQVPLNDVYGETIEKCINDGLLEYGDGMKRLALTQKGLDLSNYCMSQFLLS